MNLPVPVRHSYMEKQAGRFMRRLSAVTSFFLEGAMRPSVRSVAVTAVACILAVTSISFAAELGQKAPAVRKLPSTIRINPSSAAGISNSLLADQFKAAWTKVSDEAAAVTAALPQLEQKLAALNQKIGECRNKSFTINDMNAAGCTDNDSITSCTDKLFLACVGPEHLAFDESSNTINGKIGNVSLFNTVASQKFNAWVSAVLKNYHAAPPPYIPGHR